LWSSLKRSAEICRFREVGLRRLTLSGEDQQMRDTSSPRRRFTELLK
jgi:N-carbamoyl-L-amino-acid hydrolase